MHDHYQARRITKGRIDALRRTGQINQGVLIDSFTGFLIVEPTGSNLGDGEILGRDSADFELRPVWCLVSQTKLEQARHLLGLNSQPRRKASAPARPSPGG
jgi:hypothetical protein